MIHACLAMLINGSMWMPPRAAESAGGHDFLWYFLYYVSVFFFVLIIALMVLFAIVYRRRRPDQPPASRATHSTALELAWTIPPVVIVLVVFALGLKYLDLATPKANALTINVRAYKWAWEFEYPNGYKDSVLHMPVDQPVELVITSSDVIHSVWVPAFRAKKDAVPGRFNRMYLHPTKTGEFPLLCAEYCGTQHSNMLTTVTVHEPGMYEKWLAEASKAPVEDLPDQLFTEWTQIESAEQFDAFVQKVRQQVPEMVDTVEALEPPAITGEKLYKKNGCTQCHSVDGRSMVGPTLKGLWLKNRVFRDGSEAIADENYIRESILNPQEKVVEGYQGVMNSYQGRISDREIQAIIAYIKSLGDSQESGGGD